MPVWLDNVEGGVKVHLAVVPNAKRNEIVGEYDACLKIRIHAPPVDGAANEALIRWLVSVLKVRKSQISIDKGCTSRRKVVLIESVDRESVLCAFERVGLGGFRR